jgi:RHS repeat-associated protein
MGQQEGRCPLSHGPFPLLHTENRQRYRTSFSFLRPALFPYGKRGFRAAIHGIARPQLRFAQRYYDAQNRPAIVQFNGTKYAYIHNLQGDIVGIIDSTGTEVVKYAYDAWGKPLSTTGSLASTLGAVQPFRYRGYVYDVENGLYYLDSRYYSFNWQRAINADIYLGNTTDGIYSHNPFCYCKNNPVGFVDDDGKWLLACIIGAAIGIVCEYVCDVVENIQKGATGIDVFIPDSPATNYVAAAVGGAIAAIPCPPSVKNLFLQFVFSAGVGAAGNMASDLIRGE